MATIVPNTGTRWRVLILPGGTEIGLELRQALGCCKEVELFSAGSPISNHAPFAFSCHYPIPSVNETGWLDKLNQVCAQNLITHIIPAHDDVIVALAENSNRLKARVVSSPLRTCQITRSKTLTLELLKNVVPVPRTFASAAEVTDYPVFVKPDRGQGALNAVRADNRDHLLMLLSEDPSRIILEYLHGVEYTIDCFSDRRKGLLYAGGRERTRLRSGIAMASKPVSDPRFKEYAERISGALPLHGAWFFQLKTAFDGSLKLLEVAPRIGGTSALTRVMGVNLPLLSLYEHEGRTVDIQPNLVEVRIDRALVNRFRTSLQYSVIYVDLDDTLILRGKVNTELLKLLFQALNKGIRLVLLTRHNEDLSETLRRHRLNGLFDQLLHIRDGRPKADFIDDHDAIFIDDSFAERRAVAQQKGIPVFSPCMIEMLFDEKL
jgi:carbamoyl-phosphate synthase large subunit